MEFMRKNLVWLGLLFTATVFLVVDKGFTQPIELVEARKIDKEVARAVVRIDRSDNGGGTGTVISQDDKVARILTCYHVVVGAQSMTATWSNGMFHEIRTAVAKLVRFDAEKDLAILETDPVWDVAAHVVTDWEYNHYVTVYQRVIVLGYPATVYQDGPPNLVPSAHMSEGWLSDLNDSGKMRDSAPITYGNSGSGLFMKVHGRWTLIGVIKSVKTVDGQPVHPLTHINGATSSIDILDFLGH